MIRSAIYTGILLQVILLSQGAWAQDRAAGTAGTVPVSPPIASLRIVGPDLPPRLGFPELTGQRLTAGLMDSLTMQVLEFYERQGRIGSVVRVDSIGGDSLGVALRLVAEPGMRPVLLGILVAGQTRTSPGYLERVTRLRRGARLSRFDAALLRRRLLDTGLFARVQPPLLLPATDTTAIVQLILDDRAPGSFDLALGYLPGPGAGTLVGSGNLLLRNLFGGGRTLSLALNRLPGQSSSLDAQLSDPFVLGLDAGAEATFSGFQQDSTFARQRYSGGLSLDLGPVVLTARASREVVRPGTAGLSLVNGTQLVPDSKSRFAGLGMAFRSVEDRETPRQGLDVQVQALSGRKTRVAVERVGEDTTRVERAFPQQRLEARLRYYHPVSKALTLMLGADARALISDVVDVADLYRLGGATSLRGYDENQFLGKNVGRILAELRRALDGPTFVFGFLDLGMVDNPQGLGIDWYPGYGLGIRLETAAGLLNVSYAANTREGPRNGRVHVGIAFGL